MTIRIPLPLQSITAKSLEKLLVFCWLLIYFKGIILPFGLATLVRVLSYPFLAFLLTRHWRKILYALLKDKALFILIAFSIASLSWSVVPNATLDYIRGSLSTTLAGVYIASLYNPKEQFKLVTGLLFCWCVISLAIELIIPGYGANAPNWTGIFPFKYALGFSAAMLGIFSILLGIDKKINLRLCATTVIGSLIILIFSKSGTSLLAFSVAFALVPLLLTLKIRNRKSRFLSFSIISCSLLLLFTVFALNPEFIVVNFLGKDLTLTGRSGAWEILIRKGFEHPALGYGPSAFWNTQGAIDFASENMFPDLPPTGNFLPSMHSHNGFIEIFLALGLVGLALSFISFSTVMLRVSRLVFSQRSVESFFMFESLVMIFTSNLGELGSILAGGNFLWFLYVIIAISSAIQPDGTGSVGWDKSLETIGIK